MRTSRQSAPIAASAASRATTLSAVLRLADGGVLGCMRHGFGGVYIFINVATVGVGLLSSVALRTRYHVSVRVAAVLLNVNVFATNATKINNCVVVVVLGVLLNVR